MHTNCLGLKHGSILANFLLYLQEGSVTRIFDNVYNINVFLVFTAPLVLSISSKGLLLGREERNNETMKPIV